MPPIRSRNSRKPPPAGFEDIEDTLLEYANKMRDAQNASHEGKKKHETTWPIFQISHARSRYIYDLYYEREAISKQLYDWLLKNGYADANLIAKWKKQGQRRPTFKERASVGSPRRVYVVKKVRAVAAPPEYNVSIVAVGVARAVIEYRR
ncbi:Component of the SF3b subcomplex of the U2 snRNP [Exophiala oligosperma]